MIVATNVKSFQKQLQKFADLSGLRVGLVAKRFAFQAFRSVSQKTPVDTGRARASWNLAQGAVNTEVPNESDFPTDSKREDAALARNAAQLNQFFAVLETPVFFITSNLKYIKPLEDGHSPQIDKGYMVARTLNELRAEADSLIGALT